MCYVVIGFEFQNNGELKMLLTFKVIKHLLITYINMDREKDRVLYRITKV